MCELMAYFVVFCCLSLALDLWHSGALLVVHSVALGPGYGVPLDFVLDSAHFVKLGLAHWNSLVMTNRLEHSATLGLVVGVTLLGWDCSLRGVGTLLDDCISTNVLGDCGASGLVSADVGSVEDINQEKGDQENLHLKTKSIQD